MNRSLILVFSLLLLIGACGDDDAAETTAPAAGHDHMHSMFEVPDGAEVPTVEIEVTEDPKAGWNLHVTTTGFTLAPERASTEAVLGEGHMHLYIDGQKITRLYGEWFFLGDLEPGSREIRVELSANDHSPYAVDGEIIDDTVVVEVAGEPVASDQVIEVLVSTDSAVERAEVALGERVTLRVTSDVADQIHVHGYDVFGEAMPGMAMDVSFVADIPGVFEVELEESGRQILVLEVE